MLKTLSIAEQVAVHLREELNRGRWTGFMPGRDRLAKDLGVNGSTVERALGQLEREGLLKAGGVGKRRQILAEKKAVPGTRVAIVLYEPEDKTHAIIVDLWHLLETAGHTPMFAPRALRELGYNPERVAAMIEACPAEACIIVAGARPILERVSELSIPSFAIFGRMAGLPMAGSGPDTIPALLDAVRRLHAYGHQRIVKLSREEHLEKSLNTLERAFLDELKALNLPHGGYNLPYWKNSPDGFHQCLDELFQVTPPTAILVDEWMLYYVVQNYLAHKRGKAFRKTICISTDFHPSFNWCQPGVTHFYWDPMAIVRRALRWVNNVARGKPDMKQHLIKSKFVERGGLRIDGAAPNHE